MADGNSGNRSLYFIVGALSVAVAVGAYLLFSGANIGLSTAQAPAAATAPTQPTKNVTIEKTVVETPKVIERDHR